MLLPGSQLRTIFPPAIDGQDQVRIWNHQFIRFAAHRTEDGIVGDPAEREFAAYCNSRGWEGDGTRFDVLPHVIGSDDREPELFEVPAGVIERVPITHPDHEDVSTEVGDTELGPAGVS